MKVLVMAHGHPDFSIGGAEIAAYNLYTALKERSDVSETTFLARTDHASLAPGAIGLKRTNEYLWRQDIGDWFRLQSSYPNAIYTTFREFLQTSYTCITSPIWVSKSCANSGARCRMPSSR